MNNLITANNQFIIETEYPDWEQYKDIFKRYAERTPYSDRTQYTINTSEVSENLSYWVFEKIKSHLPIDQLTVDQAWAIEYGDGGYQTAHNHTQTPHLVSMVMYFDKPRDKVQSTDGCIFTLLPEADGRQLYTEFDPYPGKTLILDGRVWHGVYPGKQPRRCFVVNFVRHIPEEEIDYSAL